MEDKQSSQLDYPDLSQRPYQLAVERDMKASSTAIYEAWTEKFDTWFASPGKLRMHAVKSEPYYFEVVHQGGREPHYGRWLNLVQDQVIELSWVTGKNGTEGAETIVRLELSPTESGTHLVLAHSGFYSEASRDRHQEAWPNILAHLDDTLTKE